MRFLPRLLLSLIFLTTGLATPGAYAAGLATPGAYASGLAPAEPLHQRIDQLILAGAKGNPVSAIADDGEFLRRVYLDLAGIIPSTSMARAFLASKDASKRIKLIEELLAAPTYARRMQEAFHVMLMERLGDQPDWATYLHESFAKNRPWDEMARDILRASPEESAPRGAAFFMSKRLENYGQNPVDYPGLARDIGRLFLGKDLRCAQCHDHLFIKEYKQADFQGLFAFIETAYLARPNTLTVGEKVLSQKRPFSSVFTGVKMETGPRLPGGKEIDIPTLPKGKEYIKPPDRRTRAPGIPAFSPLTELARAVPASPDFSRNIVNRLWWLMMGRGLVHPLDLHHKNNPPSHPELLDLLAKEFVAHKYDIKWLLRELALTQTYQRSSRLPEGVQKFDPTRFLTAIEKRISSEQMLWAMLEATGERERIAKDAKTLQQARLLVTRAFAGPVREPEDEIAPSLKAALFLLNDKTVLSWLTPRSGNLLDRLQKLPDDRVADELYLSVLTRLGDKEERHDTMAYLKGKTGEERTRALSRLAWALLASTEFAVNH